MKESIIHVGYYGDKDLKLDRQLYTQLIIEYNRMQNKRFFSKLDPNFTSTVKASRTESDLTDWTFGVNGRIKTDFL